MKTSELRSGTTYIDGYGNEYVYLEPWTGTVGTMGYRTMHQRKATKSDVLVLNYRAGKVMGRQGVAEHKIKGGVWNEEVVHASHLKQPLAEMLAKKKSDEAVYKLFEVEAEKMAKQLQELGIAVGEEDRWSGGYDKISIPHEPLMDTEYTGMQVFDRARIVVHLSGEDLIRLLAR